MIRSCTPLLLAALLAPGLARAEPSAKEILQKARDQGALNLVGLKAELRLVNVEKDGAQKVRELTTQSKKVDGVTKTISRFKSPPDVANVALLAVEGAEGRPAELSLFAPKVRRTRKIAAGSRGESFMESEFSYADFSGASLDDAAPTREKDAQVDGRDCYVVAAKPPDSPYQKVVASIAKEGFQPLRVEYFDGHGLLKVYRVLKLEEKRGRTLATESVMENVRTGRKSTLSVGAVEGADAPDTAFTERGLERG